MLAEAIVGADATSKEEALEVKIDAVEKWNSWKSLHFTT